MIHLCNGHEWIVCHGLLAIMQMSGKGDY